MKGFEYYFARESLQSDAENTRDKRGTATIIRRNSKRGF